MMDYLNQEHPAFKTSPAAYAAAVKLLLSAAIKHSRSFRLQFDRRRLQQVIGSAELARVMPSLPAADPSANADSDAYTIHEEQLHAHRVEALQQLLGFELEGWQDLPLNYIKTISLFDEQGQMILHGSDMNDAMIFSLPPTEYATLIEAYAQAGIPPEVIEQVNVDVKRLYP